jgi:hypothetical protein
LRWSVPALEDSIKPVQIKIGQQRGEHPSLRGAAPIAPNLLSPCLIFFDHRRLEPLPDQLQHASIDYLHPHASYQLVVVLSGCLAAASFTCTVSLPLKASSFAAGRALKSKSTLVGFWFGRVKGSFDLRVGFLSHSSHVF